MTAPTRETAGAVRSAHVAYFLPPDWGRIALHAAPALERGVAGAVRLLILVPDGSAALSLARALANLAGAKGKRIVAATSAARAQRLLGTAAADAVVGPAEVLMAALGASKLKLDQVATIMLVGADELDAENDALAAVLSEAPRDAARILTALHATEGVEALIERYLPKARRVVEDVAPAPGAATAPTVRYLTLATAPIESLPHVLDELDAPSATVLCANEADATAARELLETIGYADTPLAKVTTDEIAANTTLVITLGVPGATAWQNAVNATPAQIVALISPRDLPALRLLAGSTEPRPLTDRASVSRARAAEARRRSELRAELGTEIPSREVLALEPLLREHDGLEIAAAALRLLERARAQQADAVHAAEQRVRQELKEAADAARKEERGERGDRGPRGFGDRGDRGDRGPRPFKPRGDGPRPFKPRGDRPDGPRDFKPRGDGPRPFKPRGDRPDRDDRDSKPRITSRGPYKPRGPRPPRGDR